MANCRSCFRYLLGSGQQGGVGNQLRQFAIDHFLAIALAQWNLLMLENHPGSALVHMLQHPILFPESGDRKSTRLNSSHQIISYAVFCLKKKKIHLYLLSMIRNPLGQVGSLISLASACPVIGSLAA